MTDAMRKANIRAAIWATAIVATGAILFVLPNVIWRHGEGFGLRTTIFVLPALLILSPGIILTALLRTVAWVVMRPMVTWHFLRSIQGGSFIQSSSFDLLATLPFSASFSWVFYFVIARSIYRRRARLNL
jgi:ABC-type multidrug transport system permease subunit